MRMSRFEKAIQTALRKGDFEIVHQTKAEKKNLMNAARAARKRRESAAARRRRAA